MIYKICTRDQWQQAVAAGTSHGAAIDLKDGYIHFSAAHQVRETAARHFSGQTDLVLVAVDERVLGENLKWEVSRGGNRFPHLYDTLNVACVTSAVQLPLGEDGVHQFPDSVPV
ncbi:MAG: DUF952 domain-containing protein [Planctomycetaceae bacterium]